MDPTSSTVLNLTRRAITGSYLHSSPRAIHGTGKNEQAKFLEEHWSWSDGFVWEQLASAHG
jgi:hypothetical protein